MAFDSFSRKHDILITSDRIADAVSAMRSDVIVGLNSSGDEDAAGREMKGVAREVSYRAPMHAHTHVTTPRTPVSLNRRVRNPNNSNLKPETLQR